MALELRGGVRAAAPPGATAELRRAARFLPDPRARDADPAYVTERARAEEADGFDSALVTTYSSWPDPWLVAGWALAATPRLRVTVAHRPGVTAPTAAARTLATLDRLSGGRAGVHVVIGSSDVDVRRDGDVAGKETRYRRAREYLSVFTRALTAPEPFDHDGEFYTFRDAWSGLRPVQLPRPPISFGGTSEPGVRLAAEFADVYAVGQRTPQEVRAAVSRVSALAAEHGRRLRYWRHVRCVLGADGTAARERAAEIVATGVRVIGERPPGELAASAQLARDTERDLRSVAADIRAAAERQLRAGMAGVLVGTPADVAGRILEFHRAGVDIVQIDASTETAEDAELRRELVALLRSGAGTRPAAANG
ncbi:LLM class flavin-dependent oxidoreductase [Marinactinospora rubrisoli]|uniref:LLM class flavin-dependent oxidoreductase n=1 Tax=Marinactinospora rubrisoli TaxID=2715399 RepID=A0ABW2KCR9_9ACTN